MDNSRRATAADTAGKRAFHANPARIRPPHGPAGVLRAERAGWAGCDGPDRGPRAAPPGRRAQAGPETASAASPTPTTVAATSRTRSVASAGTPARLTRSDATGLRTTVFQVSPPSIDHWRR